jgi:hypothetical protein
MAHSHRPTLRLELGLLTVLAGYFDGALTSPGELWSVQAAVSGIVSRS